MRLPILLSVCLPLIAFGQKNPVSTTWDKTITVVPDFIQNGKFRLEAFTVAIYETDGNTALELLRNEYKAISASVSGSNPMKALGCVLPDIAANPLLVVARAETDKRANHARVTMTFALNDSTLAENKEAMRTAVYNVGVRLNRTVVSRQIQAQEKLISDTRAKQQGAQQTAADNQRKIDAANAEIAQIQAKKGKMDAEKSGIEHEVSVLDEKYKRTNDAKDLDKLNKARQKLADIGTQMAKLVQEEAKQQGVISKLQGNAGAATTQGEIHGSNIEQQQKTLEALRAKLEAIK